MVLLDSICGELIGHKVFERCWHRQFLQIFAMFDMQYLQNDKSDQISFFRNYVQVLKSFSTDAFILINCLFPGPGNIKDQITRSKPWAIDCSPDFSIFDYAQQPMTCIF